MAVEEDDSNDDESSEDDDEDGEEEGNKEYRASGKGHPELCHADIVHQPCPHALHLSTGEDVGAGETGEQEFGGVAALKVADYHAPHHAEGQSIAEDGQDLEIGGQNRKEKKGGPGKVIGLVGGLLLGIFGLLKLKDQIEEWEAEEEERPQDPLMPLPITGRNEISPKQVNGPPDI